MFIKSHVRGGYRAAAEYLKDQGKNEKIRLVEISDPAAKNLDEAFHNMWAVAAKTKATKPLHHISINPMPGERLTDKQVAAIVERCEEKFGYRHGHHQRVIVEHVKDGRQHFHVIWNRVSLSTGRPVWPGEHWKKSKQICREMEKELGLKRPTPRRVLRMRHAGKGKAYTYYNRTGKHYRSHGFKNLGFKSAWPTMPRGNFVSSRSKSFSTKPIYNYFPDRTKPLSIRPIYIRPSVATYSPDPAPVRPMASRTGWPPAAVMDWEAWGHRHPRRFFTIWPELSR